MVQIQLFGGVSAVGQAGETLDVGPAKCQMVLAALALSPGSALPVGRLIDLVWGMEPPRTAEKTLQSYVARLRKGLGAHLIVRSGAAYRLEVASDAVDVRRFQHLVDQGETEAALAEWNGTPLAGLDAPGFTATVDGLIEQWLTALEIDVDRRLDSDGPAVIGALTELTANHPFREGLWALLMTALYRTGRQADALAAYRKARTHLIEGLGVEPGPRLRELEAMILTHDEQLSGEGWSPGGSADIPSGTVTFGFTEVDGAARLWAGHRSAMAAAMALHDEVIRASVAAAGGFVFSSGGDSYGVAFHRASEARGWAEGLQATLAEQRWAQDLHLGVAIGLHTGEAEERGNDYFGPAVNVTGRLAAAGHGGQILVSGTAAPLLDARELVDLGTFHLEGVVGDHRIFQVGQGDYPPLRTEGRRRGNLPQRLGRLVGREAELQIIAEALTDASIVTLVGPGGIGKTRLSLAASEMAEVDLANGAWLIELAGIASSADVPRAVADVLDVSENSARTLSESIVATLRTRQAILVLDNCEHVIDGAAELAKLITQGCPEVRILATSREGFGLSTEQLIAVPPLDPDSRGVELFNERAKASDRSFDPEANRQDVEEICRRLDGVPLAIELAAARTRSLSPADLVDRLDDRLRLLTGGRRTSVERHRTLRATIQWSYELLSPAEQTLFQRLSIFAGPFDLEAAEMVAAAGEPDALLDPTDVDDLLGSLVARSILIVESGTVGRRFRLLETIRQFGAEYLLQNGETELIASRHAKWCLDKITSIGVLLAGHHELEGVNRLAELWPNLRAAFDWACVTEDPELAHSLIVPVVTEVSARNQSEIGDWVERLLALASPGDVELTVFGLTWAAHRYMLNQNREAYEDLTRRYGEPDHALMRFARAYVHDDDEALIVCSPDAVEALREQGQEHAARLLEIAGLAGPLLAVGRFEEHKELVTGMVDRYRIEGPPSFLSWSLFMLGYSALFQGKHEEAERYLEETALVHLPDRTMSANKPLEARAAFRRGNTVKAIQILLDHIEELIESDNLIGGRMACIEFINIAGVIGLLSEASCMIGYLENTGMFGALSTSTLVASAARNAAESPEADQKFAAGQELDDGQALRYMHEVLSSEIERLNEHG